MVSCRCQDCADVARAFHEIEHFALCRVHVCQGTAEEVRRALGVGWGHARVQPFVRRAREARFDYLRIGLARQMHLRSEAS